MNKHTPGPWSIDVHTTMNPSDKPLRSILAGHYGFVDGQYMCVSGIISEADANLIAAGPDLLAALDGLVRKFQSAAEELWCQDLILSAKAAIAKAEGRA